MRLLYLIAPPILSDCKGLGLTEIRHKFLCWGIIAARIALLSISAVRCAGVDYDVCVLGGNELAAVFGCGNLFPDADGVCGHFDAFWRRPFRRLAILSFAFRSFFRVPRLLRRLSRLLNRLLNSCGS